ncbi:MAG: hypothetical protein ACXVFN_14840 [Solirubrobacteraceae bacterium]
MSEAAGAAAPALATGAWSRPTSAWTHASVSIVAATTPATRDAYVAAGRAWTAGIGASIGRRPRRLKRRPGAAFDP